MPTPLFALILAGGTGSRLWPRSRTHHPKQFLDLTGDLTMLQQSQTRLLPLIQPSHTYIATGQQYAETVARQLPDVPAANVLLEPVGRGTAAAIGLAALHIRRRSPEAVMAVLTADHLIRDTETFRRSLESASHIASEGWLVTLGIHPDYPETGYGYIERGDFLGMAGEFEGFRVQRFVEKPDSERAQAYLEAGNYDWNSGMFIWQAGRILDEMSRHMPDLHAGLMRIDAAIGTPDYELALLEVFPQLPTTTIDYGIMEKAEKVAVLPVEIGWNDVGSWSAVYDVLPKNRGNNAVVGQHLSLDTTNSLIYSPNRLVATVGVDNLVIIDTEDVLLVMRRDRAQDVRKLVEMLKTNGEAQYLHGAQAIAPLTDAQVRALFAAASPLEKVLTSLLLHAGLWPSHIATLKSVDVDLIHGWVATPEGRRPLPEIARQFLYEWLHGQDGLSFDFSRFWGSSEAVKAALALSGERAGVPGGTPLTVDVLYETLARALFEASEEGQVMRNVLGMEADLVRVPLRALFPFSLADFTGNEKNPIGARAHVVLNQAGERLT